MKLAPGGLAPLETAKLIKRKRVSGRIHKRKRPTLRTWSAPARYPANWITYATAKNEGVSEIVGLSAELVVPAAPSSVDGQLIYVFIGLQDDPVTMILQPVLHWNLVPDAPGVWSIATWLVSRNAPPGHTPAIVVQPGQRLQAQVFLDRRRGSRHDYGCGFNDYATTQKVFTDLPELKEAVCVLEAYDIQRCSDYPNTSPISLGNIRLAGEQGPILPNWQTRDRVIDCGQHCEAAPARIDLYCR
jgi:hypothetical protein